MIDLNNIDLQMCDMPFEKILETENVKAALSYLKKGKPQFAVLP